MPSPTVMMKLHAARAGQIKALAVSKGLGATEALELLLNLAIEAGEIDDALPGWEVRREGELITLTLDGQPTLGMLPEIALRVADNLEHAGTAQAPGKGRQVLFHRNGRKAPFQAELMFGSGRHGSGVVVVFEELAESMVIGEGKRTIAAMTRGMASDLARQIRKIARTH